MFALKDKNTKTSPVYLHYRKSKYGHSVNFKYPVGITVETKQWNKARLREEQGTDYVKVNKELDKIEVIFKKILIDYPFESLTKEFLRSELDLRRSGKIRDPRDFIEYSGIEILRRYRPKISFSDITPKFIDGFIDWLETQTYGKKTKKHYTRNYISRIVKLIKKEYTRAAREGLIVKADLSQVHYSQEKINNVYLSEEELKLLENVKLNPRLDRSRELFLVGCYTGMREGNYMNIDPDIHINKEKGYIEAIINKGGPKVKIPIHRYIYNVLERHNGLPEPVDISKLNINIKKICRIAGITQKVEIRGTRGGIEKVNVVEKCDLVSSHTARRTMATNLYLRNVPLRYIMAVTGHKTESQCLEYIKASGFNDLYEGLNELDFWK